MQELPCDKCKQRDDNWFCKDINEYLVNGYAKLYWSGKCGTNKKNSDSS